MAKPQAYIATLNAVSAPLYAYLTNLDNTGIRLVTYAYPEALILAIFGAFEQEIVDLRRQMVIEEVVSSQVCKLYRGKFKKRDTLMVKTGMGKKRAEKATQFTLERYPVTTIISLGFAGALTPELRIGDVVVCSTLHCAHKSKHKWVSDGLCASDPHLLSLASQGLEDVAAGRHLGSSVSLLELDSSTKKLAGLAEALHVHIVDMESYWIASIASAQQIPFIAIRSISDTTQDSVQPFDQILAADGKLLWKKAVLCFLMHPQYLMNVLTLYRNTRLAKRNMVTFISRFVTKI